ncbi:cytochrome c oxidase assembly protein COX16 [Chloropicon roscoffensis]|uniref:Cytochrome c oxidase assembly protein COX16 n=1 Tax=Chloropicon roscoffensis TaxID=1461544 RepID=A0AAX4PEG7_9CHLO
MKVPKQLRVGVPMVGVVLIGYLSLSSVLQGRIQDYDSRTLNDTPKIPDSKKNKDKIDLGEEVQRARDVVEDEYELKSTRRS